MLKNFEIFNLASNNNNKKNHNNFKELQKDNLGESGKQYNHKINILAESEMEKSVNY